VGPSIGSERRVRQIGHGTRVIDVAVGDQDFFQFDAIGLDGAQDARDVAARVDDRAAPGLLAPQEAAVLLEGSYRDDLVFHG
jgi:hypothetical protein